MKFKINVNGYDVEYDSQNKDVNITNPKDSKLELDVQVKDSGKNINAQGKLGESLCEVELEKDENRDNKSYNVKRAKIDFSSVSFSYSRANK